MTRWLLVLGVIFAADAASAHALLTYPKPRDNKDTWKDPDGPCGAPRTNLRTVFSPGAQLTVKFAETINHPGCFLISFSKAGDQDFQLLASVKHSNAGTASRSKPRPYETTVTLPDEPCDGCTLQLVQVMLQSDTQACPPPEYPVGSRYYSCADIALEPGASEEPETPDEEPQAKKESGAAPSSGGGATCSLDPGPAGTSGLALWSSTLLLGVACARWRRRRRGPCGRTGR